MGNLKFRQKCCNSGFLHNNSHDHEHGLGWGHGHHKKALLWALDRDYYLIKGRLISCLRKPAGIRQAFPGVTSPIICKWWGRMRSPAICPKNPHSATRLHHFPTRDVMKAKLATKAHQGPSFVSLIWIIVIHSIGMDFRQWQEDSGYTTAEART